MPGEKGKRGHTNYGRRAECRVNKGSVAIQIMAGVLNAGRKKEAWPYKLWPAGRMSSEKRKYGHTNYGRQGEYRVEKRVKSRYECKLI